MSSARASDRGFLILVGSILVAVSCYYADLVNLPVIAPWLDWITVRICHWFPMMSRLLSAAMWIGSVVIGLTVFIISNAIVSAVSPTSEIARLERQTIKLKRNRARIVKRRRDRDSFQCQ